MRSVKPGRGPSAMGGIGAICAVVFGVFWTAMAASSGAPGIFPLFGVLFIILGIVQAVYHFKNATGKSRFSVMDITEEGEEPDPWEERFGQSRREEGGGEGQGGFCPYCGAEVQGDFAFCGRCGKELPK